MLRTWFHLSTALCLLLPGALLAQRPFPSPSIQLHDVKFKVTEGSSRVASGKIIVLNGQPFMLRSTPTKINSLSFSQDGKFLAAGKEYGRFVVWDIASQKLVRTIETGFVSVGTVTFSPDSQFIAASAVSAPSSIKIWRVQDGQLANTIEYVQASMLRYIQNPNLLIAQAGSAYVINPTSGKLVESFLGETNAVLSTDASTLLTLSGPKIILRDTRNWTIERTLPELTKSESPVFLDDTKGIFLFKDYSDSHVFVAAQSSDGQMLPDAKLANLPNAWLDGSEFAAIDPQTGLVFGHSAGQLWALDLKTGKTCLSPQLISDSGALSPDGSLLAGAYEPESPTDDQKRGGVEIWKTEDLARACHMQ
jgi:WD40 repeat protein